MDNGPGMTREFVQNELFQPFKTTKPSGYGIGAYEAREIMREMGGRIEVDSTPGEGTRMSVRAPDREHRVQSARGGSERGVVMTEGAKPAVLVVEDDPGLQSQLKWSLSDFEVRVAGDRGEALARSANGSPAWSLLDLGLPPDAGRYHRGLRRARAAPRRVARHQGDRRDRPGRPRERA